MNAVLVAAIALLGLSSASLADCVAQGQGRPGTRTEWGLSGVKPGKPCTISLYTSGPRVAFKSLELVRPPRFGSVRFEGASIIYTPSASFKGRDSFFVKQHVEGTDGGRRQPSRMRFAVTG
jgi:hypothetical protein